MANISVRLNEQEEELFKTYASNFLSSINQHNVISLIGLSRT